METQGTGNWGYNLQSLAIVNEGNCYQSPEAPTAAEWSDVVACYRGSGRQGAWKPNLVPVSV